MNGDEFKRVQAGDRLRIPARTWNALLDALRAHQMGGVVFGAAATPALRAICVMPGRNDAAETAPWHGMASITGVAPSGAVILAKCAEPPYAVLLEPIGSGKIGQVAVSGGAYQVLVNGSVQVGARLAPVSGTWQAAAAVDGPLMALSEDAEGLCWCVFAASGTGAVMIRAKADMATNNTLYPCMYLSAAGVEAGSVSVKRPYGVKVLNGDTGFLGVDSAGTPMFVPCHARHDPAHRLIVETRSSDPASAEAGRLWVRTDLM